VSVSAAFGGIKFFYLEQSERKYLSQKKQNSKKKFSEKGGKN
jgi:hypothetical protein